MENVLLQIEHMRKHFDGMEVIKDISLSVKEGEVVSIIGPSGSGKSTMLRCATMLEKMDGGNLSYLGQSAAWEEDGKCVYAPKAQMKEIQKSFGLVFQNFNLFPHYSVMKNIIDAPMVTAGVSKKEAVCRAEKLLAQLGLSDKADAYPYQLSGGQQQRVSIGRALMNSPAVVLADEPTGNLDSRNSQEIVELLKLSNKQYGQTIIIITHDESIALQADRIMTIEDGRITRDEVIR